MNAPLRTFVLVAGLALAAAALAPPGVRGQGVSPVPLEGFEPGIERAQGKEPADRAAATGERPRLVVCFLFDQYREEYLDRFRRVWGKDGFVRLVDGGARFRDCNIPYWLALTAPGHSTWLTGATPAAHGVVANAWFDRALGRVAWAGADSSVKSVGLPAGAIGEPSSPFQLEAPTVGDVLRGATLGAGKVVSLSDKADAAVLSGGRKPNAVYWLDHGTDLMQTSTYYAETLPGWVGAANARRAKALAEARRTPWTPALPPSAFRGTVSADAIDVFPHAITPEGTKAGPSDIEPTSHPYSLDEFFAFAEDAITHEGLGADDVPDLLVLSISITDHVGHDFGPDSPEVLDLAHRVDARLARFLAFLDRSAGRGRWVASVTADHGVAPLAAVARSYQVSVADSIGAWPSARVHAWIDRVLPAGLRQRGLIDGAHAARADTTRRWARSTAYGQVTLDERKLYEVGVSLAEAARVVADSATTNPWLAAAFTADDVLSGRATGRMGDAVRAGFRAGRSGDVVLLTRPYAFFGPSGVTYTSHGTHYRYDSNVPCVFYGKGVRRGSFRTPVSTVDIAPTIAALLGIPVPARSEGRVLEEGLLP